MYKMSQQRYQNYRIMSTVCLKKIKKV